MRPPHGPHLSHQGQVDPLWTSRSKQADFISVRCDIFKSSIFFSASQTGTVLMAICFEIVIEFWVD